MIYPFGGLSRKVFAFFSPPIIDRLHFDTEVEIILKSLAEYQRAN